MIKYNFFDNKETTNYKKRIFSMNDKQTLITNCVIDYYLWQYGKMPASINPHEDADMVCCVMDKLSEGRFRTNVVYGKGEYFQKNVAFVVNALKSSKLFKETTPSNSPQPTFTYTGRKN